MNSSAPFKSVYSFADCGLQSLPHKLRMRRVLARLRKYDLCGKDYADVGCANGGITKQIATLVRAEGCYGLEFEQPSIEEGRRLHPEISFHAYDLAHPPPRVGPFDLVTCFETLEHVLDLPRALGNLLKTVKPGGTLVITVPIEIGWVGATKFLLRGMYRNDWPSLMFGKPFGFNWRYFWTALAKSDISEFRRNTENRVQWLGHWGFDYRQIDSALDGHGAAYRAKNLLTTRLYEIVAP
jgi:SAM-dependent methyltransferase